MRIWLFKDGESLPIEPHSRRMRTGMLAEELRRRGHKVHWFSSTFLHHKKTLHAKADLRIDASEGLTLHLLHAGQFRRNLSYARYAFYRRYAKRVRDYCAGLVLPDIVVCSFPLIDVAAHVVTWGKKKGIPVILDVRDLWPDTILGVFPRWVRPLARWAMRTDFQNTRKAMSAATSLTAMSNGVLNWALRYACRSSGPRDRVIPIGYPTATVHQAGSGILSGLLAPLRGRHLFSYVGTFGHTYDLPLLAKVALQLEAAGRNDLGLVLAGNGPLLNRMQQDIKGLRNVVLTGWLDTPDIRELLGQTSVGLLPWNSIDDAMPNKFFEYIAAGLPVISSAQGELNTLIEREGIGLSYRKGQCEEVTRAILKMSDQSELLSGCASRAASLFASRFREDAVYGEYGDHVEEVAAVSVLRN